MRAKRYLLACEEEAGQSAPEAQAALHRLVFLQGAQQAKGQGPFKGPGYLAFRQHADLSMHESCLPTSSSTSSKKSNSRSKTRKLLLLNELAGSRTAKSQA